MVKIPETKELKDCAIVLEIFSSQLHSLFYSPSVYKSIICILNYLNLLLLSVFLVFKIILLFVVV